MRTWGRRLRDPLHPELGLEWVQVNTDPVTGLNDMVYLVTLIQCLLLNLGESPFYSQYGIPAKPAVVQQVFPDYYVARTQNQFAPFFASLQVAKQTAVDSTRGAPFPEYRINVTTHRGQKLNAAIPIPI